MWNGDAAERVGKDSLREGRYRRLFSLNVKDAAFIDRVERSVNLGEPLLRATSGTDIKVKTAYRLEAHFVEVVLIFEASSVTLHHQRMLAILQCSTRSDGDAFATRRHTTEDSD